MQIKLKPKNRYAENRIKQHGEWWEVTSISVTRKMYWLQSLDYTFRVTPLIWTFNTRSVNMYNDFDFEIVECRESPVIKETHEVSKYPILEALLAK